MEKLKESLEAVVPIIAIVLILSFTIAPVPPGILMAFIIGAILLVVGMMFFTLGAEMSMTPGTGVSFIVPLSSVGGRKTLQFLVNEQEFEKEEETSMKDTDYELLVAIANQGYIDTVMDAARSAKAGGGTVIHAKGTGMELAKKYLGVSLVEEKEVILIVTKSREKNQIMKAIMEQAGLDSKERTIVFSLPVTSVAGIRMLEEDIQDDLL